MIGNRGKRGITGLTLLEVMIAVMVLSIGVLAMISLVGTSHRVLTISDQKSLAAQIARNKMEGLRARHPLLMDGKEVHGKEESADTGMTLKWSIAQSKNDKRLWVIIVEAFPTNEPNRSFVLKSLLFY